MARTLNASGSNPLECASAGRPAGEQVSGDGMRDRIELAHAREARAARGVRFWRMRTACLCAGAAAAAMGAFAPAVSTAQQSPAVAGFSHVKSLGGIDEYTLDGNGLSVLLVPDHSAPVVTFQVTYQVGSCNAVTGTTGATHILEHMLLK